MHTAFTMDEPVYRIDRKHHRKMLIWFLVALLIAILPWLLLAQDQFESQAVVNLKKDENQLVMPIPNCQQLTLVQNCRRD